MVGVAGRPLVGLVAVRGPTGAVDVPQGKFDTVLFMADDAGCTRDRVESLIVRES